MPGDATELQVRNKLIERRQGQILEETKAVAQEYAEYNIRVNSVHPGAVSTPGIEADDIKDVYAEAKAVGYDTKAMRQIIRLRKMKPDDRRQQQMILDTYCTALGLDLL